MQTFKNDSGVIWRLAGSTPPNALGVIPHWFYEVGKSCKDIVNENYGHGGGWRRTALSFVLRTDCPAEEWRLEYPPDPAMFLLAYCVIGLEIFCIFEHAWCAIIQPDGTYEICRID